MTVRTDFADGDILHASDLNDYGEEINSLSGGKTTSWHSTPSNDYYPSEKLVKDSLDLKANEVSLGYTNRRVTALEKVNKGQTYDIDTDTADCYTADVPSGAVADSVLMIGGKSVVMNQLVKNGNFESTEYWSTWVRVTLSTANNIAYVTPRDGISSLDNYVDQTNNGNYIVGHKYCVIGETYAHTASSLVLFVFFGSGADNISFSSNNAGQWEEKSAIFTCVNNTYNFIRLMNRSTDSTKINKYRNVRLFDLTQMFGAGNEPSTVAEFKAMFPADYYAYNTGEIKSASVDKAVFVGKNLLVNGDDLLRATGWIKNSDGSYSGSLEALYNVSNVPATSMFRLPYKANIQYSISIDYIGLPSGNTFVLGVWYTDGTRTQTLYTANSGRASHISESGKTVLGVRFSHGSPCQITLNNIQIEQGSTATAYAPYSKQEISIPSAIQQLDGYGQSNGTSVNYVDYANKKYHYFGKYVDGTWVASAETVTDISSLLTDGFLEAIEVEAGGTVTFHNTNGDNYKIPINNTNEFVVDLREVNG